MTSVLPLAVGLVPQARLDSVRSQLVDTVVGRDTEHFDTGIFGTRYLLDVLADAGNPDAALAGLRQDTYPGFGHQVTLGATTMWEAWPYQSAMQTHDHALFTGVDASLYTTFAGITPLAPGFAEVRVRPAVPAGLGHVEASIATVRGVVSADWRLRGGSFELFVVIPPNATAQVDVPLAGLDRSRVLAPEGAVPNGTDRRYASYRIGSGTYMFTRTVPGDEDTAPWLVPAGTTVATLAGAGTALALALVRRRRSRSEHAA